MDKRQAKTGPPRNKQAVELSLRERHDFVHAVLKLLFKCEYYVLVQYVKCAVPTMYSIYVAVVWQLPSAKYFPEMKGLTTDQT